MPTCAETVGYDKSACMKRLPEILVLAVVALVTAFAVSYGDSHDQYIPQVVSYDDSSNTYVTVGNNPEYMYPITLEGKKCYPTTLQLCLDGKLLPEDNKCCDVMMTDKDASVFDTVPYAVLCVACIPLPLLVLVWRVYLGVFIGVEEKQWSTLMDVLTGYLYTMLYTNLVTECFKHIVGRPRPIYYALQIFSQVYEDDRDFYKDQSTVSFPSGHASLSMAAWAYIAFILFSDAKALRKDRPVTAWILAHIAAGGLMFALWIGSTRITDYWHHTSDVVAGLVLGCVVAYTVFSTLVDCSWSKTSKKDTLLGDEKHYDQV